MWTMSAKVVQNHKKKIKKKDEKCILCIFERVVVFTFLPSISCVPWAKTLSTLAGSLNVMKPNPL